MVNRHDAGRQLRLSLALLLLTVCPAVAAAVEEDDPTRPVGSFDLRPKYEDDTVTAPNDKGSLTFRGNFTWALGGDWKLAAREDLPLVLSNATTTANAGGAWRFGLGRPLASTYVADTLDERWAFAIGSQLAMPASDSVFGSGNWDLVPIIAARAMLPEISPGSYFVPQLRYDVSFAQSFSSRGTSNLQFSPQLKIMLPEDWFAVLFPSTDIRWNFGAAAAGQKGRFFLPLDGEIGRSVGGMTVSLEASAPLIDDYPLYRFKTELRLSVPL